MLLTASVKPVCAAFATTILEMLGSLTASITPRKYSTRLVSNRPGSALASGDNIRSRSAHSLTLNVDGGANTASVLATSLCKAGGKGRGSERGRGGESTKGR